MKRRYAAVVHGRMAQMEGTVDAPIGRHPDSIIERTVTPDGQKAVTHFYVTCANDDMTSVALQLETGRTHQIRVHMSYLGTRCAAIHCTAERDRKLAGRLCTASIFRLSIR